MFGLGNTRTHAGHPHAQAERAGQGGRTQQGSSPWAAVVRPHGGDRRGAARQRTQQLTQARNAATHAKATLRETHETNIHRTYAWRTLRSYRSSLLHSRIRRGRTAYTREREERALAQVLFNTPPLRRDLRARSQVQSLIDRRKSTTREPGA